MKYIFILIINVIFFTSVSAHCNSCDSICINIKTLSGKTFQVQVKKKCTIAKLKEQIYKDKGIIPKKQIIVYKGIQLDDHRKISKRWIKKDKFILVEYDVKK